MVKVMQYHGDYNLPISDFEPLVDSSHDRAEHKYMLFDFDFFSGCNERLFCGWVVTIFLVYQFD